MQNFRPWKSVLRKSNATWGAGQATCVHAEGGGKERVREKKLAVLGYASAKLYNPTITKVWFATFHCLKHKQVQKSRNRMLK